MTTSNQPQLPNRLARKPRGLLRFGLRLPIWLYRMRLGWMLGNRFLLLTHTGRKSGLKHQTVVEVMRRDPASGACVVASGWGSKADWYQNIQQTPLVNITLGSRELAARAEFISKADGARELLDYALRHPRAFRELSSFLAGQPLTANPQTCQQLAETIPIVVFEPLRHHNADSTNG
jgi:deazaflavin-dependent oxidoreductase (nitroreductase family)